jgi:chloride channel 2
MEDQSLLVGFLLVLAFSLFFGILAVSCVRLISNTSVGSGIPEMKSILGGASMPRYLEIKTLVSKCLGLTCALAAGLSVGKEGPFVHIASAACAILLRHGSIFKRLNGNDFIKMQMLATAAAVGVSSVFGSPIGGVVFSIEVTATYYLVSNLSKCVYAAMFGAVFFYLSRNFVHKTGLVGPLSTQFPTHTYTESEIPSFLVLGLVCGVWGGAFVTIMKNVLRLRGWLEAHLHHSKITLVLVVVATTAMATFPFVNMRARSQDQMIHDLFSAEDLGKDWAHPTILIGLVIFVVVEWVLVQCSIALPIPVGLFVPVLMLGSGLGRIIGELTKIWLEPYGVDVVPGAYAVVGAAAFASGVTRTLSTSVIIFEVTGQINLLIPALIATVVATAFGNFFNPSVYDTILHMRGLPLLTDVRWMRKTRMYAVELMKEEELHMITLDSTVSDITRLIQVCSHNSYPVVFSMENPILVGSVLRKDLDRMIDAHVKSVEEAPASGGGGGSDVGGEYGASAAQLGISVLFYARRFKPTGGMSQEGDSMLYGDTDTDEENSGERVAHALGRRLSLRTMENAPGGVGAGIQGSSVSTIELDDLQQDVQDGGVQTVNIGSGGNLQLTLTEPGGESIPIDTEDVELQGGKEDEPADERSHIFNCVPAHANLSEYGPDPSSKKPAVSMNPAPFQVTEMMTLGQLHFIFSMLGISHAFVTSAGHLLGVVTKKDMNEICNIDPKKFDDHRGRFR